LAAVQLTVQELAALVGGQFASGADASKVIRGVASIAESGEGHLTFFGNAKYLPGLKTCRATAALVPLDFAEDIPPIAIRVQSPSLAFAQLVERFAPAPISWSAGVHPTAIVVEGVELGEGVSVQPNVVIEAGAKIGARAVIGANSYIGHDAEVGADTFLYAHVSIGARCIVGERVIMHSGVVIGSDGFGFEFSGGRHVKIPQLGIVQVDNDVEIGANSTIDRARFGRTWVQEGTKIDNLVQIGHNVVIGKHCIIVAQVGIAGSTKLGNYVTLAGQVGIAGHLELGDQVVIGAQSGVGRNISPKETYMGSPAVPSRDFAEQLAYVHRLKKLNERVRRLEQLLDAQGKSLPSSP
jgi:UDP-3-O-[3-hydroxymyristoyl] glucosamine N-acyltransferase